MWESEDPIWRISAGGGVIKRRIQLTHIFEDIISVENLLAAWGEFIKGKRNKPDVQKFAFNLFDNILQLHQELANKSYEHGNYYRFNISDPKPRVIHKADVRDRLLHHAIHRILYPFFAKTFISDSFSCQINKGMHRAINRFRSFTYKVSKNHTQTCWVLKCDIKKFFNSIDHEVLLKILDSYIPDKNIIWLLERIISSFSVVPGKGLPLGNLTSQLFSNIYMNKLDQFIKHKLKVCYYLRYADDFAVLSHVIVPLEDLVIKISEFLENNLKLSLHPKKVFIKTMASGVDFLGWVHFPDHRVLRTTTKRRMFKRITENPKNETLQSYFGLLRHGNTAKIKDKLIEKFNLSSS